MWLPSTSSCFCLHLQDWMDAIPIGAGEQWAARGQDTLLLQKGSGRHGAIAAAADAGSHVSCVSAAGQQRLGK